MFRSCLHALPVVLASLVSVGPGSASAQDAPIASIINVGELNDWYRAVLVDREATRNPRDLEAIAKYVCDGMTVCRAAFWTDEFSMPGRLPVTAQQLAGEEYAFGRNAQGEETSLWNCARYPEFEAEGACLPSVLSR